MDIVPRLQFMGEGVQGVVERTAVETRPVAHRGHISHAADGEADALLAGDGRAGDDRKVAVTPRDFAERAPPRYGNETASIISSAPRAVDIMPVKKSPAASFRRFLAVRRCTSPPSASSASGISALGSAWAIEPQIVPRLRV